MKNVASGQGKMHCSAQISNCMKYRLLSSFQSCQMRKTSRSFKKVLFLSIGFLFIWFSLRLSQLKIGKKNQSSQTIGNFSSNLIQYLKICDALYLFSSNEEKIAFSKCREAGSSLESIKGNIVLVKLNITEDIPSLVSTCGPAVHISDEDWIRTERRICRNEYLPGLTWVLPIDPFYFNGNIAHLHIFGALRIWNTLEYLKSRDISVKRIIFIRRSSMKRCCPNTNQIQQTLNRLRSIFPLEIIWRERAVCLRKFLLISPFSVSHHIQWGARDNILSFAENMEESLLLQNYAEYLKKVLLRNFYFSFRHIKRVQPHVLFVKRNGRRQLLNVEQLAVWSQAKKVTASVVDFSKGSWIDHAHIVSRADIFFSSHGADL